MSNKPSTTRRRSIPADPTTKLGKWSETPQDILVEISNQIDSIEDYVSFCRVCTSWRSACAKENFNQSPPIKLPWLMHETNYSNKTVRQFFSVSTGKFLHRTVLHKYRAGFPNLPYFESLGWLFTVPYHDHVSFPIYLQHPISGVTFDIPNVIGNVDGLYEHISYKFITKAVLSTHKITNPNFSVIVIIRHGSYMCLWRPGAKAWVKLDHQDISSFRDIAYHKNQLYVVCSQTVYRCKIEGSRLILTGKFVATKPKKFAWSTPYLVEPSSMDSLLVVYREETDATHYRIRKFYVFEVDLRKGTVEEVNSLGDGAIFCGVETCRFTIWHHRRSATTLVKASEDRGIKANCIYFKCRSVDLPFDCVDVSDIGLYYYNLEDGRFHACTPGLSGASGNKNGRALMRPSISFVTPTFN